MYNPDTRTIITERLILRPFELSDAENVSKLCNNYNVHKGTLALPYPYPVESALGWIPTHKGNFDNDIAYEFAVTDKETGEFYGCMGLMNNKGHNNGEAGYWFGEEFWGRGYATEGLKAVIDFAFNYKGLHRVYSRHFESNPASGRVMEKAGMVKEGRQIDHLRKADRYETLVLYGIVRED